MDAGYKAVMGLPLGNSCISNFHMTFTEQHTVLKSV